MILKNLPRPVKLLLILAFVGAPFIGAIAFVVGAGSYAKHNAQETQAQRDAAYDRLVQQAGHMGPTDLTDPKHLYH